MSIEIRELTHIYSPNTVYEKIALDHISFTIEDGVFLGLIGHTGSGKSTLVQHLNALLLPHSGEILLNGENLYAEKSKRPLIRQKVGLVFQYPEHQLFETTIMKDVSFGPQNLKLPEKEVEERAHWALKLVGMDENDFEKSPFELSGGQKRRVAIAGVLAMKPEVLILDEPTAGLDPKGRDEIFRQIQYLRETLGITIVLVSHSMEDIAKLVDQVIVMNDGKIAFSGTPKEVFSHGEALEKMGLSTPQMSTVMQKLNQKGILVPTDIFTVEEAAEALYQLLEKVQP